MIRSGRAAVASWTFVASTACTSNFVLELPTEPGAVSVIAFQKSRSGLVAFPAPVADPSRLRLVLSPTEGPLALVYFAETLEALKIGEEALSSSDDSGRPLAAPLATEILDDPEGPTWRRVSGLDASLSAFRLPLGGPAACVAEGKCFGWQAADRDLCVECIEPREPHSPSSASLPRLLPCPTGWLGTAGSTVAPAICTPLSEGPRRCTVDQRLSARDGDCRALGPACPQGDWPDPLPAFDRYVGPPPVGVPPAQVYADLDSALIGLGPGARILLARGRFTARGTIADEAAIEGTCVAGTTLDAADVVLSAPELAISRLTLIGDLLVAATASVGLSDLRVEGATLAVDAQGSLVADRVVLSDSRVTVRGHLELVHAFVEGPGPVADGPMATVQVDDVVLEGRRRSGFGASRGASVRIERSLLRGSLDAVHLESGANLSASDVVFREVETGILAGDGALVSVSRATFLDSSGAAVEGLGARLHLQDLVIQGVSSAASQFRGGVSARPLEAERCVYDGTTLEVDRLYARLLPHQAILARCARVTVRDATITLVGGNAIELRGSMISGERWTLRNNPGRGVELSAHDPSTTGLATPLELTLWDLMIIDQGDEAVIVDRGSDVTIERYCVQNGTRSGLRVGGSGTRVIASEVEIEDVVGDQGEGACVVTDGPDDDSLPPLYLAIGNFELEGCPIGADIRPGSDVSLEQGWLRFNRTAIHLRTDALDPRQLLRAVRFEDNEVIGL